MLIKLAKILLVSLFIISVSKTSSAENGSKDDSWMTYNNPYEAKAGLDIAHITGNEVVTWAQNTISEIFTLTPENYSNRLVQFKSKEFTKSGWLKYAKFLKESGIINSVAEDEQSIASIVPKTPIIVDEKVIDNEFHWILKMNTGISFFTMTPQRQKRTLKSGDYILYLDIVRVAEGDNANELKIAINDIRLTPNTSGQ